VDSAECILLLDKADFIGSFLGYSAAYGLQIVVFLHLIEMGGSRLWGVFTAVIYTNARA